jgi:hypothetical protein
VYRKYVRFIIPAVALFLSFGVFSLEASDHAKVLGKWDLEIDAGGEYYYLTMIISEAEGELRGNISEVSGYFNELPLEDILLEGSTLTMKFTSPTPPDGLEREILCSYEVGDDVLEGTVTVEELGLTASVSGKRNKE